MFTGTKILDEDIIHLYEGDTRYTHGYGYGFLYGYEYNYRYGDGCGKGFSSNTPYDRYPFELIQYWE